MATLPRPESCWRTPLGSRSPSGGKKPDFEGRAVLTSSWLSPKGSVGHVFVNVSGAKQPLAVRLDTRNAPTMPQSDADVYRSGEESGFEPLWRNASLPRDFRIELAPLESVFVEIRPVK
jgi:hypothetical protein